MGTWRAYRFFQICVLLSGGSTEGYVNGLAHKLGGYAVKIAS